MKHILYVSIACLAACASNPSQSPAERRVAVDSETLLAQIALEEERLNEATEHFLNAARGSDDPALAERAARMAHRLGLTDIGLEAVQIWRAAAPDDERSDWFSGIFETRAGRLERAIADFTSLIENLDSTDAGAGLALVVEALSTEPDAAAGTVVMSELTMRFPGTPEGHYGLARLALRAGDFDLALSNAEAATALDPEWLEARLLYARTLLVAGRTEDALTLAASLAEENEDVDVRLQYAELLLSAGRADEAEPILDDILRDNPGMPEAIRALAFLALTNDRLEPAKEHFNNLRSDSRYQNEAFYYLGRIAETEQDFLQATRSYSRVIDGSHAVEAQVRTAVIMASELGNAEGALQHLAEFGKANPRFSSDMLLAQGQLLLQTDQADAAMSLLSDAAAANPADTSLRGAHVQLYVILAQGAMDRSELSVAESHLDAGLKLYPGDTALRYSQALLLEEQGRNRRAVGVLEGLVRDQPDNAALLNALGYLLTDQFDRHEDARAYIQRALAMNPDSPAIIDSMGWVLYKLGDYAAALDYLERAYRLETDPEIAAHLVDVYWALGQQDRAREFLQTALENSPEDAHLREVRQRLEQ
jgi:tetratricopeptide (TPR) repeat protein